MDTLRVVHYDINLEIFPEPAPANQKLFGGCIAVDCALSLQHAEPNDLSHCSLDLYRLLKVEEIKDEDGAAIPFSQSVRTTDGRRQVNGVSIAFDPPLAAGTVRTIRLVYSGPICGSPEYLPYVWDHISSEFSLLRGEVDWYPRLSPHPWASEFSYLVRIGVPTALVAVGAGENLGIEDLGTGRATYTYRSDGLYRQLIVAAAAFSLREVPGATLYTRATSNNAIALVQRTLAATEERAAHWLGSKPQTTLRIIEIPEGYGSQCTRGAIWQTADGLRNGESAAGAYAEMLSRLGHEALHRWHPEPHPDERTRFLDEGLTHYLEALLLRDEIGEKDFRQRLNDYRDRFLAGGDTARSTPLADSVNSEPVSRGKGPWVFAVLHAMLGNDVFFSLLREYAHRHATTSVRLADFVAVFNECAPRDLRPFFSDWLYGTASSSDLNDSQSPEALAKNY